MKIEFNLHDNDTQKQVQAENPKPLAQPGSPPLREPAVVIWKCRFSFWAWAVLLAFVLAFGMLFGPAALSNLLKLLLTQAS
jgi:hypothetical protein